jgi:hypothetical protein
MRKQNRQLGTEFENWGNDWTSDHRVFITGGRGFRVDNQTGQTFCIGEVDKAGKPIPPRQDMTENSADKSGLIKKCDLAESRLNTQPLPDVTDNQGCCKCCGKPLPPGVRQDAQCCSAACRKRASRGKRNFIKQQ